MMLVDYRMIRNKRDHDGRKQNIIWGGTFFVQCPHSPFLEPQKFLPTTLLALEGSPQPCSVALLRI